MEGTMAVEKVQSVGELAARVAADPELQKALKENPVQALSSLAAPLRSDAMIYRMVVAALGLTLMVAAIGVIALAFFEKAIPDSVVAFGSGCVGALAGLLAPSPVARE
jgi:hypothetical protein